MIVNGISQFERRDAFIERFGFAVPTELVIGRIKKFVGSRQLLEVGAGSGLWARLLSDVGVSVTAVDCRSWRGPGTYYPVQRLSAVSALSCYRDHAALLLCWPDYANPMAAKALKVFKGDRLVYIGEDEGGCTGDDRFHEMLRSWRRVARIAIPQWPGIHDDVVLYEKRGC